MSDFLALSDQWLNTWLFLFKEGKEGEESTDTDGKGPNEMEYLRPLSTCQPTFLNEGIIKSLARAKVYNRLVR